MENIETDNIEVEEEKVTQPEIEVVEKTFTQEDMDRIIKDRLERATKKADADRKQAEELAKLSEKERATKELEIKEQEFEDERKQFYKERLELQTSKELDKLGLPIAFTNYVMGENAEETNEKIKLFSELWDKELSSRRIESMKSGTPRTGATSTVTKEQFEEMDYGDRNELFYSNKKLYDELTK